MPPSPSKPKSSARIRAQLGGRRGEALAAALLRLKLYRILARRFKTPVGEIDLIAERWGTVVFVEVKARTEAESAGDTLASVNQARILRAAQYWLARHPRAAGMNLRCDVIFLSPWRWPLHLRNAFGL